MTPPKFSVGDRVRLRGTDRKGKIFKIDECAFNEICVCWDNGPPSWEMAETLKRFKPKPQAEVKVAREFWVHPEYNKKTWVFEALANKPVHDDFYIHVREVLPNSITLTREDIAKAWDEHDDTLTFSHSRSFNRFCKALGFENSK